MKLNEIQQGQLTREQMLRSTREASLAHLNTEDRRTVVSTLLCSQYDSDDLYKTAYAHPTDIKDAMMSSISTQWSRYGKLSERQAAAVLRYADKLAEREAKIEMMPPIHINQKEEFIGKIISVEENVELPDNYNGGTVLTNRIKFAARYNITVTFKTNRVKLLDEVKRLFAEGKKLKLTSKVLWVSPNLDKVSVASMGIRFEEV